MSHCRDAGGDLPDDDFQGPTFEALSTEARLLLAEFRSQLEITSREYESLEMRAVENTFRGDTTKSADADDKTLSLDSVRTIDVARIGTSCFRAHEVRTDAVGRVRESMFLINDSMHWQLVRDADSGKYFVTEHGRVQTPRRMGRFEEWWIDAAAFYMGRPLSPLLLRNDPKSRLTSVREFTAEDGERMVEIRHEVDVSSEFPESEHVSFSIQEFQFYRDRNWVLRQIRSLTPIVGGRTPKDGRFLQFVEYQAFVVGQVPRVRRVIREHASRPRGSAEEFTPGLREVIDIDQIIFEIPEASSFRIENYIDPARRLRSPGADRLKWFFGANGLFLLVLWYLFSRRHRKFSNAKSKSELESAT